MSLSQKRMLTLEQRDKRLSNKSRRRIFTGSDRDAALLAASLGELGWSSEAIAEATGYTTGQIQTRLKFAGVWRKSWTRDADGEKLFHPTFRNGRSATAKLVASKFVPRIEGRISDAVDKKLAPEQRQRFSSET